MSQAKCKPMQRTTCKPDCVLGRAGGPHKPHMTLAAQRPATDSVRTEPIRTVARPCTHVSLGVLETGTRPVAGHTVGRPCTAHKPAHTRDRRRPQISPGPCCVPHASPTVSPAAQGTRPATQEPVLSPSPTRVWAHRDWPRTACEPGCVGAQHWTSRSGARPYRRRAD